MRLFNYELQGQARLGFWQDGRGFDLATALGEDSGGPLGRGNLGRLPRWQAQLGRRPPSPAAALPAGGWRWLPPLLPAASFRDFYAFEEHVRRARERRGLTVPEAWYQFPVFYFSNPHALFGHEAEIPVPPDGDWLDFELEVAAVLGAGGRDLEPAAAEALIAGYCVLNDWSARRVQREEMSVGLGPAKGKDFATSLGPCLVTPDELADRRAGKGYDLAMIARRQRPRAQPRQLGEHPLLLRRDDRARLARRRPAAGRALRQRHRGQRLHPRTRPGDGRRLAGAGRSHRARDRAPGHAGRHGRRTRLMSAIWELAGHAVLVLEGEAKLRSDTVYISFTGDFGFWNRRPDPAALAAHVKREAPLLGHFQHRFLNLEFILPGEQGRPADADCESCALGLIRELGFTHVSLANNHALAFGAPGLDRNLRLLEAAGLAVFGLRERPVAKLDTAAGRLAVWSLTDLLDQADPRHRVLRPRSDDLALIAEALAGAAFSIGFPHLGSRSIYPSPHELSLARRLAGFGSGLLVCTGSHFVKGVVLGPGAPIAFGLGNHLFAWDGGDTEADGMHLVAGLRDGALVQLFAIPFANAIMHGRTGPLSPAQLADFEARLADRSTLDRHRFFADPRVRAGALARLRRLEPRDLLRLRPRHLIWGLRTLCRRRR